MALPRQIEGVDIRLPDTYARQPGMGTPSNPDLEGLDLLDRAYAEMSGIAVGWVARNDSFRCACLLCGLRHEVPRAGAQKEAVAYQGLVAFLVMVAKSRCEHWEKYLEMKRDPAFLDSEDMTLMLIALKKGRRPRARSTKCQES